MVFVDLVLRYECLERRLFCEFPPNTPKDRIFQVMGEQVIRALEIMDKECQDLEHGDAEVL